MDLKIEYTPFGDGFTGCAVDHKGIVTQGRTKKRSKAISY